MKFDTVNKAIKFATDAHTGQYRKGTEIPYIVHPLEVGVIAATMSDDENVVAGAILHDTVEDTSTVIEDIEKNFGSDIASLVAGESENKREGTPEKDTWKLRKQETVDHLAHCNDIRIKIIALSDKLSNLRAISRDYNSIGEELWQRFNQKNPAEIKWYYESFLDTCSELSEKDAYKEYSELVKKVFGKY